MNSKEAAIVKANQTATAVLEVAAMHYTAIYLHDWVRAEETAQGLAEMAALSADGAQIMGQMEND